MRKRLSLLLVLAMVFSFLTGGIQAEKVDISGQMKELDTFVAEGVTMVSTESLKDYGVKYTSDKGITKLKNDEVEFVFKNNSNEVKVNDIDIKTSAKVVEKDGKVYVPFRFFFETMNYKVDWNNGKTTLTKKEEPKYPVVFKNGDKEYTVAEEPDKIVSMAPDITQTIFRIGAGDKLVGRTTYCTYPEEALAVKEIGTMYEPKLEVIVSLKPDLVMAATHFKEEHLKLLDDAKIKTFAKDTPKTMEEAYKDIEIIGNIVNRNYEARAIASTMREKMAVVSMLTKKLSKPSVYVMVGTGQSGEYVHGSSSFVNEIILASGAKNAAADANGWEYTLEKLIQKNPDYIFASEFDKKTVETGENYKPLKAIKNGHLIEINTDIFSQPTERAVVEGLKIFLKEYHPELLKKLVF